MSKKTAAKTTAPAKKGGFTRYLPALVLLIGLVIMTVCFINVNNKLNDALAQNAALNAQLNAANDSLNLGADASASLEENIAALTAQLDAANAALTETEAKLTEAEARELLGLWMLFTDVKFDLEHNEWPETSTCIQLGGCDAAGNPVYNEVTRLVIEEHHRLGLVNPKLNCRYSKQSPDEYLQVVGKAILAGHNNFVMINDDIIISGLERNGVATEDARL